MIEGFANLRTGILLVIICPRRLIYGPQNCGVSARFAGRMTYEDLSCTDLHLHDKNYYCCNDKNNLIRQSFTVSGRVQEWLGHLYEAGFPSAILCRLVRNTLNGSYPSSAGLADK